MGGAVREIEGTKSAAYAEYLRSSGALWKRVLGVQRIYAWNLRRLRPGFMLDLGCGIGRNLRAVRGHGVGVDHNATSVALARGDGFEAYTPEGFRASAYCVPGRFDSLLVSHVLEHLSEGEATELVASYLSCVRPGGQLIVITPQELGYRSDHTHRRFVGFSEIDQLAVRLSLRPRLHRSFPLPRGAGAVFKYNEFVVVAKKS